MDVRAARTALGLTQAALAQELGVTQGTISRLEAGLLPIDRRTALSLEALAQRRAPDPASAEAA